MTLFFQNRVSARKFNSKKSNSVLVDRKDQPSLKGSRWAVVISK